MKNYHLTVWGIIVLFALIMGGAILGSFSHKNPICKLDPAQIQKMRETGI